MINFARQSVTFVFTILLLMAASVWGNDRQNLLDKVEAGLSDIETSEDFEAETATLDDYLAHGALHSATLRSAFYRWKADLRRVPQVTALPEPMLTYAYFIENVETRVGPQNQRLSLRQTFPWFGTLGAQGDAASAKAEASYHKYQGAKLELFYRIKAAYYNYYFLGQEIEIARENMELLEFWESVARTKYETGQKGHPDLIKVQVELARLEDQLTSYERQLPAFAARLREAANISPSVPLPVPESLDVIGPDIRTDSLIARATAQNPGLLAAEQMIAQEEAAVTAAGRSNLPSFTFGVDYIETGEAVNPDLPESGKDPWIVSVGINLPIWFGKNSARTDEAKARLNEAQAVKIDRTNAVTARVEELAFQYEDAVRRLNFYEEGLIAKAEQSLNVAYTAYQAGDLDFLQLIDAQRLLLSLRLDAARARVDKATSLAALEMITGTDLDGIQETDNNN